MDIKAANLLKTREEFFKTYIVWSGDDLHECKVQKAVVWRKFAIRSCLHHRVATLLDSERSNTFGELRTAVDMVDYELLYESQDLGFRRVVSFDCFYKKVRPRHPVAAPLQHHPRSSAPPWPPRPYRWRASP